MQSDKHWGVYLNEFCCRFPLNETPVKFIKSWGLTEKLRLKASVHKRSKIKFVIILQIYHEYYSWQKWIYSVLQEAVYYARLFACKRSGLRFTRSTFAFPSIISVVTKILKNIWILLQITGCIKKEMPCCKSKIGTNQTQRCTKSIIFSSIEVK